MLFKDIQKNSTVFILDKQEFKTYRGKVISAFPRMEMNNQKGQTQMMVDTEIEVEGKIKTYSIPENLSVSYAGNIVLSVDSQGLVNEIQSMQSTAEQIINSVPYQKEILEKAPGLLAELHPQFRERQETEKRFGKIETEMKNITGDVNEIKSDLKELLKKLS